MIAQPAEQIVILGGGVAGLSTGLELVRRGYHVTVLEQGREVGGLARTFVKETAAGQFRFDIGGHRFHSHKPEIIGWVQALMGDDLLRVPRISRIYLPQNGRGKFVDYPLQFPGALSIFPPAQAARILSSYAAAALRHRLNSQTPAVSFEDWVVQRFGRELYRVYFEPYTEKVWGVPCTELSADWAAQRINLPSLTAAIRRAIFPGTTPPATIISHFWYPRLGFGMIPERMHGEIERLGGRVLTAAHVVAITPDRTAEAPASAGFDVQFEHQGGNHIIHADRLISSIPLNFLLAALPAVTGSRAVAERFTLRYRDIIVVYLALAMPQVSSDSWTYFPGRDLLVGRTHEPRNWSAEMAPAGYTSLSVEIFTSQGEPAWQQPDNALIERAMSELIKVGFLPADKLTAGWVHRIKFAYPLYDIGYAERVREVRHFLARWPNLHLVGRTGSFHYMNSDGVIEDALRLVDFLTGVRAEHVDVSRTYKVD